MSNYTIAVAWNGKDALSDSDPAKVISGDDFHTEFSAIQTATNSKAELNGSATESFSATTANSGTNTTQVATTEFVQSEFTKANINGHAYPVGSIYTAVVSTNPATLLGVGTWSAFGSGRVLVGVNTGDSDFDTVEETGGSKTHTLETSEIPSHEHIWCGDDQLNVYGMNNGISEYGGSFGYDATSSPGGNGNYYNTSSTGGGGSHTHTVSGSVTSATIAPHYIDVIVCQKS